MPISKIEKLINTLDSFEKEKFLFILNHLESYIRSIRDENEDIPDKTLKPTNTSLAEQAATILKDNLDKEINLNSLASRLMTNRNKLSMAFKAKYGQSIFNWLRDQRLDSARRLLISTSKTISQIANEVGYLDSNNFSTTFKKKFGMSPIRYRKYHRSNNPDK